MKNTDTPCKHKPPYVPDMDYGGKNATYTCKYCGKRIKADGTVEALFVMLGTGILCILLYLTKYLVFIILFDSVKLYR